MTKPPLAPWGSDHSVHPARYALFSHQPRLSTMDPSSRRQKRQDRTLFLLNAAIKAVDLAKEASSITPATAVFGPVSILLTTIRVRLVPSPATYSKLKCNQDSMANKTDYVELGLACAEVCKALDRGMNGRKVEDLSPSVCEAIGQLTT